MNRSAIVLAAVLGAAAYFGDLSAVGAQVTVRTERYPRPPYSEATYYVYERGGAPVCTKLEVCNKYGECGATYHRGRYRAREDRQRGEPYGTSPAVPIRPDKLKRHACLVRHRLLGAQGRVQAAAPPGGPVRGPA